MVFNLLNPWAVVARLVCAPLKRHLTLAQEGKTLLDVDYVDADQAVLI